MTPEDLKIFEAAKQVNADQIRDILLTPENPNCVLPPIYMLPPGASSEGAPDPVYMAIREHVEEFFVLGTEPDLEALIQYVQWVYDDGWEDGYDEGKSE